MCHITLCFIDSLDVATRKTDTIILHSRMNAHTHTKKDINESVACCVQNWMFMFRFEFKNCLVFANVLWPLCVGTFACKFCRGLHLKTAFERVARTALSGALRTALLRQLFRKSANFNEHNFIWHFFPRF